MCVDGPAGSGKSTLAAELAARASATGTTVRVLHLDDLYEGWRGLAGVAERLRDGLVGPLADRGEGRYRRWDWLTGAWAEQHVVTPVELLVLEGVGAGTPELDPWRILLVWVDAPGDLRRLRGIERDGEAFADQWQAWAADEEALHTRERTRERADLLVDGTGAGEPVSR